MRRPVMMSAVIPFAGFYNSVHDDACDYAMEQYFQTDNGDPWPGFQDAWEHVNWTQVQTEYAKAYVHEFAHEFKIKGMVFEELNSPREYNFTTDRIFVRLPLVEVWRMKRETPKKVLDAVAAEKFTSRSGFSSHYSPHINHWPNTRDWDHNQVFALIEAYARHENGGEFDHDDEFDLMESDQCNGSFENWIAGAGNDKFKRLDHIYAYLRERHNRKYRHTHATTATGDNHAS